MWQNIVAASSSIGSFLGAFRAAAGVPLYVERFFHSDVQCPVRLAAKGQYEAPPRGWVVLYLVIRLIVPRLILLVALSDFYQIIIHDFGFGRPFPPGSISPAGNGNCRSPWRSVF